MKYNILSIETSCDDTSIAILNKEMIIKNITSSQLIHSKYGGVIPEIASRCHMENISILVDNILKDCNITLDELDVISFTRGPGLLGSLLVGSSYGKSLAYGLNIPVIGINHMYGHIMANFINKPYPQFPFLCVIASGGHTQLAVVKNYLDIEIVGKTLDDSIGEAFDKIARIMGFNYPGGPIIDKMASMTEDYIDYKFPFSRISNYDYSFSGIKTSFLNFYHQKQEYSEQEKQSICKTIQDHLVNMLLSKAKRAMYDYKLKNIALSGGVAANSCLRNRLQSLANDHNWNLVMPEKQYCTDNASMIAIATYHLILNNHFNMDKNFVEINTNIEPNLQL